MTTPTPAQAAQAAEEREAFEAHFKKLNPLWKFQDDGTGGYHNERTELAWIGWKARALPAPRQQDALPRELMEAHCTAAEAGTMEGFRASVIACMLTPAIERLMEKCYRMGFESGWRIRENEGVALVAASSISGEAAAPLPVQGQEDVMNALEAYANIHNWDVDAQGIRRVWREPNSAMPSAYNGFEKAAAALRASSAPTTKG